MDVASRTTLTVHQPRPQSTSFETTTTMDYLREREALSRPHSRLSPRHSPQVTSPNLIPTKDDPQPETSNLEFLKSMEESDSKASRRSSLGSLSGSKNILATKFGDAFKRFEGNQASAARTPSPLKEQDRPDLTPIAGSEATDHRSDDGQRPEETDNMTPEMRREMERRKLEEEEQRVEAAQAEYRKRVAAGGNSLTGLATAPKPSGRASTIQNRVQSLLDDQRSTNVPKTATGYGTYSDAASSAGKQEKPLPEIPRKPIASVKPGRAPSAAGGGSSASPALSANKPAAKPVAPKKPGHLNSFPADKGPSSASRAGQAPATERLIAVDLPGQPALEMTAQERDSYLEEFSQRFPSLSAMESDQQNGGAGR